MESIVFYCCIMFCFFLSELKMFNPMWKINLKKQNDNEII